jgi:tRNA(Ser,Leu) C12 N-acetylase TAN1
MEPMKFTSEDGKEEEFYVEEQVRVNGTDYLLVTTSGEDDAEALILKDISEPTSEEADYVPVEDETELDAVLKVFRETLDDTEIEG